MKKNILISTIGTGRYLDFQGKSEEERREIKKKGNYERTTYLYSKRTSKSSIFAKSAIEIFKIDRLILYGTSQSMWDEVLLHFFMNGELEGEYVGFYQILTDKKATNEDFDQNDIDKLNDIAQQHKLDYHFYLINSLIDKTEQEKFANNLFSELVNIKEIDNLFIDITHAYRHIPYLIMPIAMFSKDIFKNIKKIEIIYGMYEGAKIILEDGTVATRIIKLSMFPEILKNMQAANNVVNYGDAKQFIKFFQKNQNPQNILNFSKSINLGLLDESIEAYKKMGKINTKSTFVEKSYNKFKEEYSFLMDENKIKITLQLGRKFFESFKINQTILMLSQLLDILKKDKKYKSIVNANAIKEIKFSKNIERSLKNTFQNYITIEKLLDSVRNRIAHAEFYEIYEYDDEKRKKQKEESKKIFDILGINGIIEFVQKLLEYLEKKLK